ncbi:hypothetical protein KEM54_003384 [Ascosphaera aggregata]|nr:hypothetical protein KEM54_003384 [Ascosphaera aggregata]
MCGKFETVGRVLEMLKNKECTNTAVREFVNQQEEGDGEDDDDDDDDDDDHRHGRTGKRRKMTGTKRWGVAWSWMTLRPGMETARNNITAKIPKHFLPFPSEYALSYNTFPFSRNADPVEHRPDKKRVEYDDDIASAPSRRTTLSPLQRIFAGLQAAMEPLQMHWRWNLASTSACGVGWSNGDVWSRKARRAKTKQPISSGGDGKGLTPQDAGFGVRIEGLIVSDEIKENYETTDTLDASAAGKKRILQGVDYELHSVGKIEIKVRWLKGADGVLFESFCGMMKRKIKHETA